jgi:hypothetical protein
LTLIELAVALAVVALLAGLLAPVAFQSMQAAKEDTIRKEVERIFKAIVGDPNAGNFGYLGDMGRLPATLSELVEQGAQVAFHTTDGGTPHVGNVGTGWRGPYLSGQFAASDLFRDAWGQSYSYTNAGNPAGQIVSGGRDATVATGDDIRFPSDDQLPVRTTGTLIVTVVVNNIPQPALVTVEVFVTSSTGEQTLPSGNTKQTNVDGKVPFSFAVPHGICVVRATHGTGGSSVTRIIAVPVAAGTQVSRQVVLFTTAAVAM